MRSISAFSSIGRTLMSIVVVFPLVALGLGCGPNEICDKCDKGGKLEWCTSCDSSTGECTETIREKGGNQVFSCMNKVAAKSCVTNALLMYCDGR